MTTHLKRPDLEKVHKKCLILNANNIVFLFFWEEWEKLGREQTQEYSSTPLGLVRGACY